MILGKDMDFCVKISLLERNENLVYSLMPIPAIPNVVAADTLASTIP